MEEERFNGWTNYETWAVALWIDNEPGVYQFWREAARRLWREATTAEQVAIGIWSRHEAATFYLSDQIREETNNNAPQLIGMYGDLLHAALCEVNWTEIAEGILTEVIESAEQREAITER